MIRLTASNQPATPLLQSRSKRLPSGPNRWQAVVFGGVAALFIVFASGCRSNAYYEGSSKRTTGELTDDIGIQSSVKTRLIRHGETRGWRIDVDVFKGVVQLAGYVRSEAERETAASIARSTKGVRSVDNKLVIKDASN